jgi:hypothetical protein
VTPFSGPALERGLAGCLLAMIRHGELAMTPPAGAMELDAHRAAAEAAVENLVERACAQPGVAGDPADLETEIRILCRRVLDRWQTLIAEAKEGGARTYSPYDVERSGVPLLHTALDEKQALDRGDPAGHRFVAPTSMRDVEPTVHLWLKPAGWSFRGGRR